MNKSFYFHPIRISMQILMNAPKNNNILGSVAKSIVSPLSMTVLLI
jgi:hypothetical protein